jgi:FkbM family methyltransferase
MNAIARRIIMSAGLGGPYRWARMIYNNFRISHTAKRIFADPHTYLEALKHDDGGKSVVQMRDGLKFQIRRNRMDASILAEVFLDKDYANGMSLSAEPIVIDIGGYIGDFAIYAATHLRAKKVVTIEPSPANWELLQHNIALNRLEDRVFPVQGAVTDGSSIKLDLGARNQARVSAHYGASHLTEVPGISLAAIFSRYQLSQIDLLKLDCEGGEYQILSTVPDFVLERSRNVVFEFHEIEGFVPKLHAVKERLANSGFDLSQRGHLITAVRHSSGAKRTNEGVREDRVQRCSASGHRGIAGLFVQFRKRQRRSKDQRAHLVNVQEIASLRLG